MTEVCWLIEYREAGTTTGYVMDLRQSGGPSLVMTRDAHKAMKFKNQHEAQAIIDDTAFQNAFAGRTFAVVDHMFIHEGSPDDVP